jgi:hypothetical protein
MWESNRRVNKIIIKSRKAFKTMGNLRKMTKVIILFKNPNKISRLIKHKLKLRKFM